MGPAISALAFSFAAVAAAFLLRPRALRLETVTRASLVWLFAAAAAFLIPPTLVAFILCGIALVALAPRGGAERAAYYVMTAPAFPSGLTALVPFPGINYVVALDFAKVACIAILLPMLFLAPSPPVRRHAPTAGIAIILLSIFYSIQEFRSANLTSGLRASLDNFLLYAVPYLALVRLLPRTVDFDKLLAAFLFLSLVFAAVVVVSEATSWNFYTYALTRRGYAVFADFRYGLLRANATLIPILVGFVAFLGFIATEHFRARGQMGALSAWILRALMAATAALTVARGAWLAFLVGAFVFYLFAYAPRILRSLSVILGAFVVAPATIFAAMSADLGRIDRFGTFEYRRQLLEASWVQFRQAPIFGDPNYATSGNFDHLVQGEGIIDFVNFYLQIALEHGLVGLLLFFGGFAATGIGLLRLGRRIRVTGDRDLELKRAALLAMIAAYLAMMATVSDVSMCVHFGVMTLAFAAALIAAASREDAAAATARADEAPAARLGDLNG